MHRLFTASVFLALGCTSAIEPASAPNNSVAAPAAAPEPLFTQGNASCDKRMGPALAKETTLSGKLALYERGCDLGCAPACDGAGTLLRTAPSELRNDERAAARFERACAAACARGCVHLGELHEHAPASEHVDAAKIAYRRACDLGDGDGCSALGALIETRESDPVAAVAEYSRGCELDSGRACAALAAHYELAEGVALDAERAYALYEHACERHAASGCRGAAQMLARMSDSAGSRNFEQKAAALDAEDCNDGEAASCALLADAYRDGRGVEKDVKRAARFYAVGCEQGVESACEGLKRLPGDGGH
jgi:TPR repeat protein